ncbi:hypothetical protein [Paenibacillus sp. IHBB 10380]|uniref:hypothetical protein n=1 Tax=Paenibacillus sp. IHBB 10380 TaxID=1566358 RepID=UPI0005CFD428|nr:hypothetical protein [Paenibacillus sp. IHBB 10380]AJS58179.1 hypothetical protein UB51_06335 [Paenibacillus sp. IHBB 10380]
MNHNDGNENKINEDVIPLTQVVESELLNVEKIEMKFSDGHTMTVSDLNSIQNIVSTLKSVQLQKLSESTGAGYLYSLHIYDQEKWITMLSTFEINGNSYRPVGNVSDYLHNTVIGLGRERIPNLLSGIELKN